MVEVSFSKARRNAGTALTLAALLVFTGCKPVGPNYHRPGYDAPPAYKESGASTAIVPPPDPAGGTWKPAAPSDGMLKGKWWEVYRDPELNKLEDQVTPGNQNLRAAMESYLAARDQVRIARADLYPTLSAAPGVSRARVSANRPLVQVGATTNYADFQLEGQASWEPDFWGRVRRTVESAHASAQASASDLANLDLSLH